MYGQNEWRDDIRKMLMKAGIIGKPLVFLFADNQVGIEIVMNVDKKYCTLFVQCSPIRIVNFLKKPNQKIFEFKINLAFCLHFGNFTTVV